MKVSRLSYQLEKMGVQLFAVTQPSFATWGGHLTSQLTISYLEVIALPFSLVLCVFVSLDYELL